MTAPSQPPVGDEYRAWQSRVCTALGMDPAQVYALDDEPDDDGHSVSWGASALQVGHASYGFKWEHRVSPSVDGGRYYSGRVVLTSAEWAAVIEEAGPRPRAMTREQELILKGLAAEMRGRPGR